LHSSDCLRELRPDQRPSRYSRAYVDSLDATGSDFGDSIYEAYDLDAQVKIIQFGIPAGSRIALKLDVEDHHRLGMEHGLSIADAEVKYLPVIDRLTKAYEGLPGR
jgi:hypothetical protein